MSSHGSIALVDRTFGNSELGRAAFGSTLSGGTLLVRGTNAVDSMVFNEIAGNMLRVIAVFNGTRQVKTFAKSDVNNIRAIGLDGNDRIFNNTSVRSFLFGQGGDDQIRGGSSNDRIIGHAGNDVILGRAGNDFIRGMDGNDRIFGEAGVDVLLGDGGNDFIRGGNDNDRLVGGNDNDRLFGDAGNDRHYGGAGNDVSLGGIGDDFFDGGDGRDISRGGDGNDRIVDRQGNDRLFGEDGNDTLLGGLDDDFLDGGKGIDTLLGQAGNDTLLGQQGNDILRGNNGNDRLRGGAGNDTLRGEAGNDNLQGNAGNDILLGGAGNDFLHGQAGVDSVQGGTGVDLAQGFFGDTVNAGVDAGDRSRTWFFVDNNGDTADGNFAAGQLTFREAIANSDADDFISFTKLGGSKIVNVTGGQYVVGHKLDIFGGGIFDGAGNGNQRFMVVNNGADVELNTITIRNFTQGSGDGGAIYVAQGRIDLETVTGVNNRTNAGNGGFLFLLGDQASAEIERFCVITGNAASANGGGISSNGGVLTIHDSVINGNQSGSRGGGLDVDSGSNIVQIVRSSVAGNTAANRGGGIHHRNGSLTIKSSTISGNQSTGSFGGGLNSTSGATEGTLNIVNSTVSGNLSANYGAGITTIILTKITNSTIVFNSTTDGVTGGGIYLSSAPTSVLNNTIVFGNTAGGAAGDFTSRFVLDVANSFNNIIGTNVNTTFTDGTNGNIVNRADIGLDVTLGNNGGATLTHRLFAGSIAIDQGNNAKAVDDMNIALLIDQTQQDRTVNGTVDIGAVEYRG